MPRLPIVLARQMECLGLDSRVLQEYFATNPWLRSDFQPGDRHLLSVARYHPNPMVASEMLERLANLSFTDFLMTMHVPYVFMGQIEDELFHCRTFEELYYTVCRGHPAQPQCSEAIAIARLAFSLNSAAAYAYIKHNAKNHSPLWTE